MKQKVFLILALLLMVSVVSTTHLHAASLNWYINGINQSANSSATASGYAAYMFVTANTTDVTVSNVTTLNDVTTLINQGNISEAIALATVSGSVSNGRISAATNISNNFSTGTLTAFAIIFDAADAASAEHYFLVNGGNTSIVTFTSGTGTKSISFGNQNSGETSSTVAANWGSVRAPATKYDMTLADGSSDHGTVAFTVGGNAATQAKKDDVVTVSVTPNEGYSAKDVTVKAYTSWDVEPTGGSAGTPSVQSTVTVTKNEADGTWSFTMPEANVWVVVTYTKNLQDAWIEAISNQTYTGSAIEPAVVVKDGDAMLALGTDYTVAYADNVNAGTATVTVTAVEGSETYSGSATATFTIQKADITVTAPTAKTGLTYTGAAQALVEAGSASFGTMLYSTDGENYSAEIPTSTAAADYTVYYKVDGDDNHNAFAAQTVPVSINAQAPAAGDVTVEIPEAGAGEVPTNITVTVGETTLTEGTDYTVTYQDSEGNPVTKEEIEAAMDNATEDTQYTVVVTLTGNYSGSKEQTFTVKAANVAVLTIPAKCYISYYTDKGLNLATSTAEGVVLTTVKEISGETVVLYDGRESAAAETPRVIYNGTDEEQTVTLRVNESAATVSYDDAHYFGTVEAKTFTADDMAAADHYVLDGRNFTWVKDAGTLPANRCWLEIVPTVAAPARALSIVFEGETTGINTVSQSAKTDGNIYDLSCRRVMQPTKGLYIIGGKKVVIK